MSQKEQKNLRKRLLKPSDWRLAISASGKRTTNQRPTNHRTTNQRKTVKRNHEQRNKSTTIFYFLKVLQHSNNQHS
jgi:hypothetical protein